MFLASSGEMNSGGTAATIFFAVVILALAVWVTRTVVRTEVYSYRVRKAMREGDFEALDRLTRRR